VKTILAAVDLSKATGPVCDAACALARLHKARLVLLHVVLPPFADFAEYYAIGVIGRGSIDEILAAGERAAGKHLREWTRRCAKRGVEAHPVLLTEAVVAAILEKARTTKASTIVMGSHGHGGVYTLVLGSTVSGVLRKATCPVLVVPIGKHNQRS
jgi:nucleotide-binding universal stress UspA family protein